MITEYFYYCGIFYIISCIIGFFYLDKNIIEINEFAEKLKLWINAAKNGKIPKVFSDMKKMEVKSNFVIETINLICLVWFLAGIFIYDGFLFSILMVLMVAPKLCMFFKSSALKKVLIVNYLLEIFFVCYIMYHHLSPIL